MRRARPHCRDRSRSLDDIAAQAHRVEVCRGSVSALQWSTLIAHAAGETLEALAEKEGVHVCVIEQRIRTGRREMRAALQRARRP